MTWLHFKTHTMPEVTSTPITTCNSRGTECYSILPQQEAHYAVRVMPENSRDGETLTEIPGPLAK